MSQPTIDIDHPRVVREKDRYSIHIDEQGTSAGFTLTVEHQPDDGGPGHRIFPHTEVAEQYSGKGLASQLVRGALEDTVNQGLKIVAICPYVKSWIQRHEEYEQHTVKPTPAHLNALG